MRIDNKNARCRVGNIDVEPERNVIRTDNQDISVEPRVMDVLCALIDASGDVVSRDELIEKNWDTVYGADESLTRIISQLRKTIRDANETDQYIETISKRGYRLVQPVTWRLKEPDSTHDPAGNFNGEFAPEDGATLNPGEMAGTRSRFANVFALKKWRIAVAGVAVFFMAVMLAPQAITSYSFPGNKSEQANLMSNDYRSNPAIVPNSIAVLPFMDLSPTNDQEYFSDGISEEILNVLARIDGLKVSSRTSSFQFKGRGAIGIPAIASELRVRYILQGSVRKAGESIRITTQLIDSKSDQQLWSATFNRTLTTENIFAIQEEIANATVDALENRIHQAIGESPSLQVTTSSVDAYEAFLKARTLYQNRMSIHEAETLLLHSITLDPDFADAWALRSAVYIVVFSLGPSFGEDNQSDRAQSRVSAS